MVVGSSRRVVDVPDVTSPGTVCEGRIGTWSVAAVEPQKSSGLRLPWGLLSGRGTGQSGASSLGPTAHRALLVLASARSVLPVPGGVGRQECHRDSWDSRVLPTPHQPHTRARNSENP
jgi:hypothetical protein